jgi:TolB-like protein
MILVVVLLTVGFIISVIISWIYDIHPEDGIVKTEPAHKVKEAKIPDSSRGWKMASYISFVVIVGLIVLNIIPRTGNREIIDKSIAVLPFRNESSDDENTYFINGVMDGILDNLSRVKDLRVISRNSVEKYRDDPKSTPVVAEEMDVGYVLEGSGQKVGNRLLLTLQLIVGDDDRHIWSKQYDREIERVEDLIDIQKEVAQLVASEIEAVITPEEIQLIEKPPTSNLTAYDYYLKAREEYVKIWVNAADTDALDRAESLYSKALQYDTTFSAAYAGLGWIQFSRNYALSVFGSSYSIEYFDDERVDSVEILTDWALRFDDQNVDALILRGVHNLNSGKIDEALTLAERALEINPNHSMGLIVNSYLGMLAYDYILSITSLQQALKIERGIYLPWIRDNLFHTFWSMGLPDESESSLNELIAITGDSVVYYSRMIGLELLRGNPQKVYEYTTSAYELDSQRTEGIIKMGDHYYYNHQYREAYPYYDKHFDHMKEAGQLNPNYMHRMAHVLWELDSMEEATDSFNQFIEVAGQCISRKNIYGTTTAHYDLAGVYAFLEDRQEAYSHLEAFAASNSQVAFINKFLKKRDPLFENIRHEERFQQIVRDIEAKYQAEHERVRQWLDENDML